MTLPEIALSGLLFGLAGGIHCAAMCGPLAIVLNTPAISSQLFSKRIVNKLVLNGGRIATYGIMGAMVGTAAQLVAVAVDTQVVSVIAGILMIVTAIVQFIGKHSFFPTHTVNKLIAPYRTKVFANNTPSLRRTFLFGVVNALLPCGYLFSALFGALAVGSMQNGAVFMTGFGVGTLPVLMLIGLGWGVITNSIRKQKYVLTVLTLVVGVSIVLRGLGLGIPYISPEIQTPNSGMCSSKH